MIVNKMGYEHLEYGVNCQDYGIILEDRKLKVVCDGCSQGKSSEVGAKLYCHLREKYKDKTREEIFKMLTEFIGTSGYDATSYLCFTVIEVTETEEEFIVERCGDGYILAQRKDGKIEVIELTDGEYPKYYVYNYIDKSMLKYYEEGVDFESMRFSKEDYVNIGIASDGFRFALNHDNSFEFMNLMEEGREIKVKRFINKNIKQFKDDITIVM